MRKRATIIFTILFLLLSTITACASGGVNANVIEEQESTNIKIKINGVELKISADYGYPFIDTQNRTMIPLRIISESLGHKVEWDNKTQTANIDKIVFITVGENIAYGLGNENNPSGIIEMDTKAILKDSRTYVPLRFVVEALGYEVKYDSPKESNGYNHIVDIERSKITRSDIFKEGMTTPEVPTDTGDGIKIKTESGTVTFNADTDVDKRFGGLTDDKAIELIEAFHKSMKLAENKNNITLSFYQPTLPEGMEYTTFIEIKTKNSEYLAIYDASKRENSRLAKLRDDGYIEVIDDEINPSEIQYVLVTSRVKYKGDNSILYVEELKTGKKAIGENAFLGLD
ncbi:copper amine oxidase N-terminal domain-containing protein [Tissierella sp.]|uniref:copper amine oxidase N-terminal domain-containing protein n=1 Tax=Tissierella sp. TaxID=41274 RepID=UPI00306C6D48